MTVESIRLARPVDDLTATFGLSSATCGQGFTNAEALARCTIVAPRGARISPTSTSLIVISYRLTRPVTIMAPDVVVTCRSAGETRTTSLGLDICLSGVGSTPCPNGLDG